MKPLAESYEDEFEPQDDFLDEETSDLDHDNPFFDAEMIERRLLGGDDFEQDANSAEPAPEPVLPPGERPFGARLAEANVDTSAFADVATPEFSENPGFDPSFDPSYAPEEVASGPLELEPASIASPSIAPSPAVSAYDAAPSEVFEAEDDGSVTQPIPSITIGAFCETQESGQLIHNACTDRRMQKAQLTVELGGLPAAIERYHDQGTPELLIVESGMRGRALFEQLEELAAVCDAETKVIIIGAANDITLYRELMRRGVSEYLVPPMSPMHIIKTVSGLFLDPEAPFAGRSIAFVGAKGGVGSSTVAHNVAWHLTEGVRTNAVLVDLDLSFGTAGLDFNQDPPQTIAEALSAPDRLDEALLERLLVQCTERLSLFSAPATLDNDWDFTPEQFDMVLDRVRRQAPFMLIDLPHAWTPWVRETLLSADQVVVTVTPDLACLRNAKNLFDLVRQARPNDQAPRVVVNMAGCPKKPDIPLKDFADALGAEPTLVLPFEPALFGKAANNGQMISEVDEQSKAAEGFEVLAEQLAGRSTSVAKPKSLLSRLFSKR